MNREVHVQFWEGVGLRCPALLDYLKAYESVAQARAGIAAYFRFYNHERLHQALGYRTPRQVFEETIPFANSPPACPQPGRRAQAGGQASRGARPSRAPLGQLKESWPARRNALRPRTRNLSVFRPPSEQGEGRPEKL